MIDFKAPYNRENFSSFLDDFLPYSTVFNEHDVVFARNTASKITNITSVGTCSELGLQLLEVKHSSTNDARVGISKEFFKIMRDNSWQNALVAFVPNDSSNIWRLSFVKMSYKLKDGKLDYETSNPRRYSFLLGLNQHTKTPEQYLSKRVNNLEDLEKCFSVETLTKEFYTELYNWYLWAKSKAINVHFPNDSCDESDDRSHLSEHIIRLITRLMFVWFIKQKDFVPSSLFDPDILKDKILTNFDATSTTSGNYYNAILQNLFFASLNKKITERKFAVGAQEFGIKSLFRDNDGRKNQKTWFKISHEDVLKLFEPVPFLNGGLFECLDKIKEEIEEEEAAGKRPTIIYSDGFSRDDMAKKRAFIPNALFFAPEHNEQIDTDTKNVSGIITIFNKYNFTVEENTPSDVIVALDPELLGKVFENLLASYNPETGESARKSSGSFYTPREVVNYMVDNSINEYLKTVIGDDYVTKPDDIKTALYSIKIIDPACGSGAFPMGILNNIFDRIQEIDPSIDPYKTKLQLIENCIYGVDIQPIAVQISKLRFFISLICEQKEKNSDPECNYGIAQLPNLETKFVAANTLIKCKMPRNRSLFCDTDIENIKEKLTRVRHMHFNARTWREKQDCRDRDKDLRKELLNVLQECGMDATPELREMAQMIAAWNPYNQNQSAGFFDPEWMFGISDGFDIVIGNPPYVSNKKTDPIYGTIYGFNDDLYNYFFIRSMDLCKKGTGILAFITSNTFLTLESKHNIRDLLQNNRIILLNDLGAGVFLGAVVNTVISIVQHLPSKSINYDMSYIDSRENFNSPKVYKPNITIFRETINNVFFSPNENNMKMFNLYGRKLKELYDHFWPIISTSKNIEKNLPIIDSYRKTLKPGDITLLGLLTDGGQGLATANNGKYIAVMQGTKFAENIKNSRPKKLKEACKKYKITELNGISNFSDYLSTKTEAEIAELFDSLKEKYGRDIFGQGYLFKIITSEQVANVDTLSQEEKENGIKDNSKCYVVYDKGDKDGNRWYLESPYYIAWSEENVRFLKTNSGKKGEGMPVVRNSQFYFNEGFCWSDISDTRIRCRIKNNGVYDVKSMSLFSRIKNIPDAYFICLLNSSLIGKYIKDFLNNTVSFQINDARKIPVIIPNSEQLESLQTIFKSCCDIKRMLFDGKIKPGDAEQLLSDRQSNLDEKILELYNI